MNEISLTAAYLLTADLISTTKASVSTRPGNFFARAPAHAHCCAKPRPPHRCRRPLAPLRLPRPRGARPCGAGDWMHRAPRDEGLQLADQRAGAHGRGGGPARPGLDVNRTAAATRESIEASAQSVMQELSLHNRDAVDGRQRLRGPR